MKHVLHLELEHISSTFFTSYILLLLGLLFPVIFSGCHILPSSMPKLRVCVPDSPSNPLELSLKVILPDTVGLTKTGLTILPSS
jgi:hypothetical protein